MLEEIVPLTPVHFFAFGADCLYYDGKKEDPLPKTHLLPDLAPFQGNVSFASVKVGWHERGFYVTLETDCPFRDAEFPDIQSGDSIEIFFDTRDVKTRGFNTRFCHHFFFLPEAVDVENESIRAGEITRFRTEDAHELCDPTLLFISGEKKKRGAIFSLFIPAECLVGYEPAQFDRIGFTYRINRRGDYPQFFSASAEDFSIEQQPSLWATLKLKKS